MMTKKENMEFESWRSYWNFCSKVKQKNRYFPDEKSQQFLEVLVGTSNSREIEFQQGHIFYRAQLGCDSSPEYENGQYIGDLDVPHEPSRMRPLAAEASEGRVNPKGIPFLYLATNKETAMAEVRPWIGSYISVAEFQTSRILRIVDCSLHYNHLTYFWQEPDPEKRENAVWSHVDESFSRPVENNERIADYIPTQIVAEWFKKNGFDGIYYKSLLGDGHNLTIFNIEDAIMLRCHLFKVKRIKFCFERAGNSYSLTRQNNKKE